MVAAADGSTPPVTLTAAVPVTPLGAYGGGGYCWAGDDTLVYAAADGRLVVIDVDGGGRRVLVARRPRRRAGVAPGGRPRGVRARARRRLRRGRGPPRRLRLAATSLARRLCVGSRVVGGRHPPGLARVGPPEHAVGRVADHVRRGRRRAGSAVCRGRRRRRGGQPRFSPDRRHAGVRVGSRRLDERVGRRR